MLERIGHGAFGEVYRAWDTRLDREVALKLLPADSSPVGTDATSIIEEGRLLARVRHPNVVTIYGAERIGDRIGLWMEFIKGRTLAQVIEQDGAFEPARVLQIGTALCHAVDAVHKAGLLHRDIKAQNVMLADDGRVVLMDFGTGRELGRGLADRAGTPLYLAPELLSGSEASAVSDVYSIGVVLYYLLSRSYPVRAADMRGLRLAHERGDRSSIKAARPDVPPKLARVVEHAIDPRPESRHQSADALVSSLAALSPRPRLLRRKYAIAFAIAIALAIWIGSLSRGRDVGASAGSATRASASGGSPARWRLDSTLRPVIAVLPLKNLSAEPDSDYFVDGLTDELIRNLAVIDGLDVRSRTSSFFFKGQPRNLRNVAEQLGVNLVVEGSVLRLGNRLRVNAQLVDVASDTALWSQQLDRDLKDVFAIQDEISRAVINQLRLTLGRGQRRYDMDVLTYDLYLKGRRLVLQRGPEGPVRAAEIFRQVIARHRDFAPAHAGLATAYAEMSLVPYATNVPYEVSQPIMRSAALEAVDLDPMLAEAHVALGLVYSREFDWENANKSFRRALELNPGLTEAYTHYSYSTLRPLGQHMEADRLLRRALAHDPLSLAILRELGELELQRGRNEEAIAYLKRVKATDPDFPRFGYLGRAFLAAGRLEEAFGEEAALGPWQSFLYVRAGRRAEAEKMIAEHRRFPFRMAIIKASLGDADGTIAALQRMRAIDPQRLAHLLIAPEFSSFRSDPRFVALRASLNLPPRGVP